MRRLTLKPRSGWEAIVESQGLTYHSRDSPYWNEEACYAFSSREIDTLELAGNQVHELCLEAARQVIEKNLFEKLAIDPQTASFIKQSWNKHELSLYGRFDFAYDGFSDPKVLEYNADTPTSLLEASVIQWYWLKDQFPSKDQFNLIHESLVAQWKKIHPQSPMHFTSVAPHEEDEMTIAYLRDTARQAGMQSSYVPIESIGYNSAANEFRDLQDRPIRSLFKLYPWEWIVQEEYGKHIDLGKTHFIEPAWKMLWSNKGILPLLWEIAPHHPNLLPAYREPGKLEGRFVQKPYLSREGANVMIYDYGKVTQSEGVYGKEGYIYQAYHEIPAFEGKRPVMGLWMVGDTCVGMGIRETDGLITGNLSRFTPHYFE